MEELCLAIPGFKKAPPCGIHFSFGEPKLQTGAERYTYTDVRARRQPKRFRANWRKQIGHPFASVSHIPSELDDLYSASIARIADEDRFQVNAAVTVNLLCV